MNKQNMSTHIILFAQLLSIDDNVNFTGLMVDATWMVAGSIPDGENFFFQISLKCMGEIKINMEVDLLIFNNTPQAANHPGYTHRTGCKKTKLYP